jgi:hypothetical protein
VQRLPRIRLNATLLCLFAVGCTPRVSERSHTFRVLDARTHQPLADVEVKLLHWPMDVRLMKRQFVEKPYPATGADGLVTVPDLYYSRAYLNSLRFERAGYRRAVVHIGGSYDGRIDWEHASVLSPVTEATHQTTTKVPLEHPLVIPLHPAAATSPASRPK